MDQVVNQVVQQAQITAQHAQITAQRVFQEVAKDFSLEPLKHVAKTGLSVPAVHGLITNKYVVVAA